MMKLYFSPGSCSLAPHIVLYEGDFAFRAEKVDLSSKRTASGNNFLSINPKGYVPALELEGGELLTEGATIVQYLADLRPDTGLMPAAPSRERLRVQEWLNFIATELHKGFKPLFQSGTHESCRSAAREHLTKRFGYVDRHLGEEGYLFGSRFTVADAYCFTIVSWLQYVGMGTDDWPRLKSYFDRISARPAVQRAWEEGGLPRRSRQT
jgi:glutathione S-transferase